MKEEYSPRDLQFEKVKGIYAEELRGTSLKQMEIAKKMFVAQKQWREEAEIQEKQEQQKLNNMNTINHHRHDKPPFFSDMPEKKQYRPKNKQAFEFMRKLELLTNPESMNQADKELGILPLGTKAKKKMTYVSRGEIPTNIANQYKNKQNTESNTSISVLKSGAQSGTQTKMVSQSDLSNIKKKTMIILNYQ